MLTLPFRIDAASLSLIGALGATTCGPNSDAMDGDGGGTATESTTGPTAPTTTGPECQQDSDCTPSCSACQDGMCIAEFDCCREARRAGQPCPMPYEECYEASDCPGNEVCDNYECVPPCYEDSECYGDHVCVLGVCEVQGVQQIPVCPPARVDVSTWMIMDPASDVELADLDGDGDLDLAFGGSGRLELAFNDGAGAFTPGTLLDVGPPAPSGMLIATADLDGDGVRELVVVDALSGALTVLRGDGGNFVVTATIDTLVEKQSLITARVDGDGIDDIVTVDGGFQPKSPVSVFLGDGAGGLSPGIRSDGVSVEARASFVDITQDGLADVTARDPLNGSIVVAPGDGFGRFTNPMALTDSMEQWTAVLVGPLDGDTLPDVVATRTAGAFGRVSVRPGLSPGPWGEVTAFDGKHSAVGSLLADFDGDGLLDLVSASHQDHLVSVLLGDGTGAFSCEETYPGVFTNAAEHIAAGDIDGDGRADLVAVDKSTAVVTVIRHP